jgi:hypothetical protein
MHPPHYTTNGRWDCEQCSSPTSWGRGGWGQSTKLRVSKAMEATNGPDCSQVRREPRYKRSAGKMVHARTLDDPASRHSNKLAALPGELLSNIDLVQLSFP